MQPGHHRSSNAVDNNMTMSIVAVSSLAAGHPAIINARRSTPARRATTPGPSCGRRITQVVQDGTHRGHCVVCHRAAVAAHWAV